LLLCPVTPTSQLDPPKVVGPDAICFGDPASSAMRLLDRMQTTMRQTRTRRKTS
jgi:hypothetical protein